MLEIRPNCECCDKDLPPEATDAYICSYECTFCRKCVDNVLFKICPNCGGEFVNRPIRPTIAHRENTSLIYQPASSVRVNTPYSREEITAFSHKVKIYKADNG